MPRFPHAPVLPLIAAVATLAVVPDANAFRLRLDARSGVLAYPLIARDGLVVLDERLVESRILLRVDDLIPLESPHVDPGEAPDITFAASLRWFTNPGVWTSNTDPESTRFIPGVRDAGFDLLYAWVEAAHLWDGIFDARVGRLVHSGALGWRSDDGGLVRLAFHDSFRLQAIGGLENVRGLRLSASPFAPDGVERWSAEGLGTGRYGEPHEPGNRPVLQVSLDGVAGPFRYDFGWRRVWRSSDGGISAETAAFAVAAEFDPIVLAGSARVDAALGFLADAVARATLRLGGGAHRLDAQYEYFRPTFDLESIFLVFASEPFHEATLRYRFPIRGPLSGEAWATARRIDDEEAEADVEPVAGPFSDLGGGVALAWRSEPCTATARWKVLRGGATSLAAFDLLADVPIGERWSVFGAVSAWQYEDRVRDADHGIGGGGRAGATVEPYDGIRIEGEVQLAQDEREGLTFAVFAWLDLGVAF